MNHDAAFAYYIYVVGVLALECAMLIVLDVSGYYYVSSLLFEKASRPAASSASSSTSVHHPPTTRSQNDKVVMEWMKKRILELEQQLAEVRAEVDALRE